MKNKKKRKKRKVENEENEDGEVCVSSERLSLIFAARSKHPQVQSFRCRARPSAPSSCHAAQCLAS
jgi:hypothetical protein